MAVGRLSLPISGRIYEISEAAQRMNYHYSQLHAKASVPDTCSIPIQANKAGQTIGISLALNDTVVKIARAFNARRNMRFLEECCDAVQCRDRKAFVSRTKRQVSVSLVIIDY